MKKAVSIQKLLILGSKGSVGQGVLKAAKEQGIEVIEFDRKLGNHVEKLTVPGLRFTVPGLRLTDIIYTAEKGNRDLYDEDPTLVKTNLKNFTHFCKLVSKLDEGGS